MNTHILEKPAPEIKSWLGEMWSNPDEVLNEFDWLEISQVATSRAFGAPLEWAEIAVSILDHLIQVEPEKGRKHSLIMSAMLVSSNAVERFGPIKDHPVLDPYRLVNRFFEELTLTRDEADAIIRAECETGRIQEKRSAGADSAYSEANRIKYWLLIIQRLVEAKYIEPDTGLQQWLSLLDQWLAKNRARLDNQLLERTGSEVLEWLQRIFTGTEKYPPDFNWHGVAEVAAMKAVLRERMGTGSIDLSWAEVAVDIYGRLASHQIGNSPDKYSASLRQSANNVRMLMIQGLGTIRGHPVLDANHIVDDFYKDLRITRQEFEELSQMRNKKLWPRRELRENLKPSFVQLVYVSSYMRMFHSLIENNRLVPDTDLQLWIQLWQKFQEKQ